MSNANSTQIGGTHYKTKYEHWDFVTNALYGRYLEGNVTKYVSRWRKKNGLEDLKKAQHYLHKLMQEFEAFRVVPFYNASNYEKAFKEASEFSRANELNGRETEVMLRCATWFKRAHLVTISEHIIALIQDAEWEAKRAEAVKVSQPTCVERNPQSVAEMLGVSGGPAVVSDSAYDRAEDGGASQMNDATQQDGAEPGAGYVDQ